MKPIEPDDDIMTLEEFRDSVRMGFFVPDDGSGVLATRTEKRDEYFSFDEVMDPGLDTVWTHVVWYNK